MNCNFTLFVKFFVDYFGHKISIFSHDFQLVDENFFALVSLFGETGNFYLQKIEVYFWNRVINLRNTLYGVQRKLVE